MCVSLSLFFFKSRFSLSFDPFTSARVFTQKKTRAVVCVFLLLKTKSDTQRRELFFSLFVVVRGQIWRSSLEARAFDSLEKKCSATAREKEEKIFF